MHSKLKTSGIVTASEQGDVHLWDVDTGTIELIVERIFSIYSLFYHSGNEERVRG